MDTNLQMSSRIIGVHKSGVISKPRSTAMFPTRGLIYKGAASDPRKIAPGIIRVFGSLRMSVGVSAATVATYEVRRGSLSQNPTRQGLQCISQLYYRSKDLIFSVA